MNGKMIRRAVVGAVLVAGCLLPATGTARAADAGGGSCDAAVARIGKMEKKVTRELRQIKRDLAEIQQAGQEVTFKDVAGGIGYILGLFGLAALVASRKGKN